MHASSGNLSHRCYSCQRKVTLAMSLLGKCKCGHVYCSMHRYPEEHECEALEQMREDSLKRLGKSMVMVTNEKIKKL